MSLALLVRRHDAEASGHEERETQSLCKPARATERTLHETIAAAMSNFNHPMVIRDAGEKAFAPGTAEFR